MLLCKKPVTETHVNQLAKNLEHYLTEVTGEEISTRHMDLGGLPYLVSRQYDLYRLEIGDVRLTAVFLQDENKFKPTQFIKHMQLIPSVDMEQVCVVAQSLPTYVRKRLIERGISFVIPMVQMYLPTLGMELRPRYGRKRSVSVERFSPELHLAVVPVAQVVLIHWLLGRMQHSITPLELSKQLWYSAMSMSRALDQLESTQIAHIEHTGNRRLVTFVKDRKDIWNEALPRLRNPISKTVRVLEHDLDQNDMLVAGTTALSVRSMLSQPQYPEYAVSRDAWKAMQKRGAKEIPIEELGTCLLQVWCYDPCVLQLDGLTDPFSLYLSLQNDTDERIQMALDEMMVQFL